MADPTPSLGFKDYFLVNCNALQILSGGINEIKEVITADSIHGYGGAPSEQKAFEINYQKGTIDYSADLNANIFLGNGDSAKVFRDILNHTINPDLRRENITVAHYAGRATLPDNNGKCLVSNFTLNYTAGQIVNFSTQFKSTTQKVGTVGGSPDYGSELTYAFENATPFPPYVINDDMNPLGWYDVSFDIDGIPSSIINSSNITNFNLLIDNSTVVEHTFTGEQTASRISQGQMRVSGKITYIVNVGTDEGLAGYDPFLLNLYLGDIHLVMPHCFVKPDPLINQGVNNFIIRSASLVMFAGDGYEASIYEV